MGRYVWTITSVFLLCCGMVLSMLQEFKDYHAEHYLGHNVQKAQQKIQSQAMACHRISHQLIYTCQEQEGIFHQMLVMYYDHHRQIIATDHIVQLHFGERSLGLRKNNQLDELGADYDLNVR